MIVATSATGLFEEAACRLIADGVWRERRGQDCLELPYPATLHLTNPAAYVCLHTARNLNPWTMLAEFPWLMAGRSDIRWLLPYLPSAAKFSDDGVRWRAGYGPRFLRWPADGYVDQIYEVVTRLQRDPSTRQAIISLWDPARDNIPVSRDYPCTQTLHFQQSGEGCLDLIVHMRSNDLIWGASGVNIPNFCLLQHMVAQAVGMAVGEYYHIADNLHIYERHYDMVRRVAARTALPDMRITAPEFADADNWSEALAAVESMVQRHTFAWTISNIASQAQAQVGSYVAEWMHFMLLWQLVNDTPRRRELHKTGGDDAVASAASGHLREVDNAQWRLAAAMWMMRSEHEGISAIGRTGIHDAIGGANETQD